jgi:integrase
MALIRALLEDRQTDYAGMCHGTILLLILFTGIRTSEAMGLQWRDIDFDRQILRIERDRIFVQGKGTVLDSTKTMSSERTIALPAFLTGLLRELRQAQDRNRAVLGRDYTPSGYVCATETGAPQFERNTYYWFVRLRKRHGLRHCTVHDLRHTHAAMLSGLEVKIIDVSKRLGHSNTRVTQEVYEYLFKDVDREVSDKLDDYFQKIIPTK